MERVKKEVNEFMASKYDNTVSKSKLRSIQRRIIRRQIQRKHKYKNNVSKTKVLNTDMQTNVSTLDVSDDEIIFVSCGSFITAVEDIINQPFQQSSIHDSTLIKDDKIVSNY